MRGFSARCMVAAVLLAAAWAQHDHHHHDHKDDVMCRQLSSAVADFGFALYKNLNGKAAAGENIFFSPVGISTALSMLSVGARGQTHAQLFSALGYGDQLPNQVNERYQHLLHMLGHSQEEQELEVGNAIALRTGFDPLAQFIADVKTYYSSDLFNVDFNKPAEALAEINQYIARKTNNKIQEQLKDLDASMAMVLINYVYFRGLWLRPFNESYTKKADFFVDANTKVEVDMMSRMGRYDLYLDDANKTSVLMLPYKSNTSMMIILPDEGKMSEVEAMVDKDYIKHSHNSLYRQSVIVKLPKFSMSAEASLDGTLKEMGMIDAFESTADFSGISTEVNLKLSKASHKAVLSVDETGTEAAAVTTLEVMPMSMPMILEVNRPFLVYILEDSTQSILFMGKISNPTQ